MSFESRVIAFSERFLSDRGFELIVSPALADLPFDRDAGTLREAANRLAVIRAVAGGLRDEVTRDSGSFVRLTLLSASYHLFPLVICFDLFSTSTAFFLGLATLILVLSFGSVVICFWPARHTARPVD